MNSQLVIVKDVDGAKLVRCVCACHSSMVFVTSEKAFQSIKNGSSQLYPIGFHRENVFEYDKNAIKGKVDWHKLKPWSDLR